MRIGATSAPRRRRGPARTGCRLRSAALEEEQAEEVPRARREWARRADMILLELARQQQAESDVETWLRLCGTHDKPQKSPQTD